MIRIIAEIRDAQMAVNVGGSVHTSHKFFDIDLPELEKLLAQSEPYIQTRVIGAEVLS